MLVGVKQIYRSVVVLTSSSLLVMSTDAKMLGVLAVTSTSPTSSSTV